MKHYLVNFVVPKHGDRISVSDYRKQLEQLGYNFYQQIGSLGGASNAGTVVIENKQLTRN